MKRNAAVGLKLILLGVLMAWLTVTGAAPVGLGAANPTGANGVFSFSREEISLFKRIALYDNPRDPDAGPPFIYADRYRWTPDHDGKVMQFDKAATSDYPNSYRVVYYPGNRTVLFTWDGGQADRGCGTYIILDRLIIKTVTAGGLSIQYEKVYHNGVPVYYKVAGTGFPEGDAAPRIKPADLIGKWILKPDMALNFKSNGDFGDGSRLSQGSWSFNPYNREIYINVTPPAVRTLKVVELTGKYLKVSEAGKVSVYRK